MKILKQIQENKFPIKWANLDYLPNSEAKRVEIYLTDQVKPVEGLLLMFQSLFKNLEDKILIYEKLWWDFCLDTWNPITDQYDYGLNGKSEETKDYLLMLKRAEIPLDYSGSCECFDWNSYLSVILKCIISHRAPYSPILYNEENGFLFYFHHSGSIGIYYRDNNAIITNIIEKAEKYYVVKHLS